MEDAPEIATTSQPTKATGRRSSFKRDMIKLVSGTVSSQLVMLAASPIIARFFDAHAFGVAAAVTSISAVIGVFLFLRYDQAIVLPERDEDAARLIGICIILGTTIACICGAVLFIWGETVLAILGMEALAPYLWIMIVTLFISVAVVPLSAWNTRVRSFGIVAGGQIVNSTSTSAFRVGVGLAGNASAGTMLITALLGQVAAMCFIAWTTLRVHFRAIASAMNWQSMIGLVKRYSELPRYGIGASLLNSISWQLPVFILTGMFSPEVAGQYALGQRVIRVPMSLVGSSVSSVYFAQAATAKVDGTLAGLTRNVFHHMVQLGIAPTLFLALAGNDLFAVVFGSNWAIAGQYVQILAPWSFVWFLAYPISQLQLVLEEQRFSLIWNIVNFTTRFASLWIGALQGSAILALALFGLSGVVVYGFQLLYLMRKAGVSLSVVLGDATRSLLPYIPSIIIGFGIQLVAIPAWSRLLVTVTSFAATAVYALRNEPEVMKTVSNLRARLR